MACILWKLLPLCFMASAVVMGFVVPVVMILFFALICGMNTCNDMFICSYVRSCLHHCQVSLGDMLVNTKQHAPCCGILHIKPLIRLLFLNMPTVAQTC